MSLIKKWGGELLPKLWDLSQNEFIKTKNKFEKAELKTKSEMATDVVVNLLLIFIPASKISKIGKSAEIVEGLSKVEKGAETVSKISLAEKEVKAVESISKVEKEAEVVEGLTKANRSVREAEKVAEGVSKLNKVGAEIISNTDRLKLSNWKYAPTDNLYIKYKKVFDNPKYYDQVTGAIHWPVDDGYKAGSKVNKFITKGTIFKRYGENSGEFLGNATDSFESRALAPHSESAQIHYYQLTEGYRMTAGKTAPWFGTDGGAEQFVKYKPDGSKYTIKELEDAGILDDVTDLVKKGDIKID